MTLSGGKKWSGNGGGAFKEAVELPESLAVRHSPENSNSSPTFAANCYAHVVNSISMGKNFKFIICFYISSLTEFWAHSRYVVILVE